MNLLKLTIALLFISNINTAYAANLETDKERLSYSMGVFFGQSIIRQDMDMDIQAFLLAVEDILNGNETKITATEMQKIFSDYQRKEQQERANKAETNKQNGLQYLEQNKGKKGVTTLASGLQYKVIKTGEGKKPTEDSTVVVHYRGTLIDGTEFDSSYSRGQPAEFGVNQVIKGWQEVLLLMTAGSKWEVVIPSDLAYGKPGTSGIIGPDATLLFDIELISIK